jgi:hypothetical protein
MKTLISKQFTLVTRDFLNGLKLAIGSAIIPIIQQSLAAGELKFNWELIGVTALGAAVAYLAKNYFEPTKIVTVKTPGHETN